MTTVFNQLIREKKYQLENTLIFLFRSLVVDKTNPNSSKSWQKVSVFLSFQTSILNKCYIKVEKCADDVLRWLSSRIDLVISDVIYHGL